MIKRPDFSLDNFKKWMEEQESSEQKNDSVEQTIVGTEVQSKISLKKLINKIEIEEGIEEDVCNDFVEDGGIIVSVNADEDRYLIEVASGKFYLDAMYTNN